MGRYAPGQSGNPQGRPVGSTNKSRQWLNSMAADEAGNVLRAVLDKAKAGDMVAAGLVLARLWPVRKATVRFTMPPLDRPADLVNALAAITVAVSEGILAPSEAADLAQLLNAQRQAIEMVEFEERLAVLERKAADVQADRQSAARDRRRV